MASLFLNNDSNNKNNKNNKILFISKNLDYDLQQSKELDQLNNDLCKKCDVDLINNNSYYSIKDNIDYLGCVNNNCKSVNCTYNQEACQCKSKNNSNENNENNKKNNLKNTLGNYFKDNQISKTSESSKKNYKLNIKNFFDLIITILFIILVLILCVFTYYYRKSENLIYILILCLIFIFYKIFIK